MAHNEQIEFCTKIKKMYSERFQDGLFLDIGSLDINGNNRYLFADGLYFGVDIGPGQNVDIISKGHELDLAEGIFDVIVSTECFEHDMFYEQTLRNIYRMLKPGGMLLFTCATTGRPEHGTRRSDLASAILLSDFGDWADYYKNLTEEDFRQIFNFDTEFSSYHFEVNYSSHDIYFYGFKTGQYVKSDNIFELLPPSIVLAKVYKMQQEQQQEVNLYKAELQEQRSQIQDLQTEINKVNKKLEHALFELNNIKNSKIWRLKMKFSDFITRVKSLN